MGSTEKKKYSLNPETLNQDFILSLSFLEFCLVGQLHALLIKFKTILGWDDISDRTYKYVHYPLLLKCHSQPSCQEEEALVTRLYQHEVLIYTKHIQRY